MLPGPFAARCAQVSRRCQSRPCWTPQPGTLQGGLLWAEQGTGQVERGTVFTLTAVTRPGAAGKCCPWGQDWERARESRGVRRKRRRCRETGAEDVRWQGAVPQREAVGGCRGGGLSEHRPDGIVHVSTRRFEGARGDVYP